jgi:uroporphyrinogen-III synthase
LNEKLKRKWNEPSFAVGRSTVDLLKKCGLAPVTYGSEGFHAWNNWRDYLLLFRSKAIRLIL